MTNIITENNKKTELHLQAQVWESFANEWKRWVINNVPVEDVHLVLCHGILSKYSVNVQIFFFSYLTLNVESIAKRQWI